MRKRNKYNSLYMVYRLYNGMNNKIYSEMDFIKDEIKEIKEKFGVDLSVIKDKNGKYRIISEEAVRAGRGDFYLTRPIKNLGDVGNVLTGMYSVLYVKDGLLKELLK